MYCARVRVRTCSRPSHRASWAAARSAPCAVLILCVAQRVRLFALCSCVSRTCVCPRPVVPSCRPYGFDAPVGLCSVMCVRSTHRSRAAVVVLRSVARSRSRAPPHTHKSTCDACMRPAWAWPWTWAHAKCTSHNPAACHSRVSPPPLATPVCLARPREGGARVWVVGSFHMCSSRARVAFWY